MALLDQTDDQWLSRLSEKRRNQANASELLWKYFDNAQPSAWVARLLAEQGNRFPECQINWSELVVAACEERLDIDGFRIAGSDDVDEYLAGVWQDNDLDESSGEAHTASMVAGQSYLMLGPAPDDSATGSPLVTVEYSDQVAVEVDPGSRRVVAALKQWKSDDKLAADDMAQLMLPGRTIVYQHGARGPEVMERTQDGWGKALEAHQTSPLVPVVPMFNRHRRGLGFTELKDIIPLVNAVNLTATNMLAGVEHHALPRRWAINLDPAQFKRPDGSAMTPWEVMAGALWAIPPAVDDEGVPVAAGEGDRPQIGQFTASDLNNYAAVIKQLATLAASKYGLPPHYLGYSSENPASADAIRSSESRLVKRAERHQRGKGGAWEAAMRIALAMRRSDSASAPSNAEQDKANRLETLWRDASTPTASAQADRTVKLVAAGIIDVEQGQEDLGYTPTQILRMRDRRAAAATVTANVVAGLQNLDLATQGARTGAPGAPGAPGTPPAPAPAAGAPPRPVPTPPPAGRPNPSGNGGAAARGR